MHTTITAYSYGGFTPWADIVPPHLKPGDTLESRANKFRGAGNGCQYRDPPPLHVGRDVSNQGLSFRNVKPSDYKVPDKRGVSAVWANVERATRSKPFLGTTNSLATMQDPKGASSYSVNEPEWLAASKKQFPEPLPREPALQSSHQADFGTHLTNDAPQNKAYMYKSGMASTTNGELAEGTSKQSFHLPGYGGTIPSSSRNAIAASQGLAAEPRTKGGNMRMYYRQNMVGYSGWGSSPPLHATNDKGEAHCGANPASTSGAAALNLML